MTHAERATPDRRPQGGTRKRFQPAPGTAFDLEDTPTIDARARSFLARGFALFAGVAVALTAGCGVIAGSYVPLGATWAVVGPILGAIYGFYFGSHRKD